LFADVEERTETRANHGETALPEGDQTDEPAGRLCGGRQRQKAGRLQSWHFVDPSRARQAAMIPSQAMHRAIIRASASRPESRVGPV
jgi:hypothetical protein